MKILLIPVVLAFLIFSACESTDDILEGIDHEVPDIMFVKDSVEVNAGESLSVEALVEDESGIERIEFSYGSWRINEIIDLSEDPITESFTFSTEITVPEDAIKQWEEDLYFNDASSIKINQQYHRLALSAWDKNRNLMKASLYVKVK